MGNRDSVWSPLAWMVEAPRPNPALLELSTVCSSKIRNSNVEIRNKFESSKFKISKLSCLEHLKFGHLRLFRISDFVFRI